MFFSQTPVRLVGQWVDCPARCPKPPPVSGCAIARGASLKRQPCVHTADLRAKILDFRGLDSSRILIVKGWNSQAHREFPRKFGSSNLSGDHLSMQIGRIRGPRQWRAVSPTVSVSALKTTALLHPLLPASGPLYLCNHYYYVFFILIFV